MLCTVEYVWIDGKNEIRSKTKVIDKPVFYISEIPDWNYDGSSTWQADGNGDTEIILKPCAKFCNPLREQKNFSCHYIAVCDTYCPNGEPTKTNNRVSALKSFNRNTNEEPWFGLEQEYFIINKDSAIQQTGYHYCGTSNSVYRLIAEKHLQACFDAGIQISGINAEVADGQWEFQIGPCEGINSGDHLIAARYLLLRIAEQHDCSIYFTPKLDPYINGSGCHINFSTESTRKENGLETIHEYISKLANKHKEHIAVYGEDNHLRLTGIHETSSMEKFSWGVGTRNTSIRIPNQTFKDKRGYFEDRRPAANIDPYLATSIIFETCCL